MSQLTTYNQLSTPTPDILTMYERHLLSTNLDAKTVGKYVDTAKKFTDYLAEVGKGIRESRKEDILGFINKNKVSASTWNNYLTYLKQLYKWMQGELIMPDITTGIRRQQTKREFAKSSIPASVVSEMIHYFKTRIEVAERSEDGRVKIAPALRDYAFFCVVTSLGSRAGLTTLIKVGGIRMHMLENGAKTPVIDVPDKRYKSVTTMPIPPYVFEAIEAYILYTGNRQPESFLFKAHSHGADKEKPISYGMMWKKIEGVFIKLGVKTSSVDKFKITPHALRHSLAELLLAQYGMEYVKNFYGHASINTTMMYAGRNKRKEILNNRPDIEGIYGI